MALKKLGAAAAIFDAKGHVLLVKHSYGHLNWELPGGQAEADESMIDTALREATASYDRTATVVRIMPYSEGIPHTHTKGSELLTALSLCR